MLSPVSASGYKGHDDGDRQCRCSDVPIQCTDSIGCEYAGHAAQQRPKNGEPSWNLG